MSYLRPHVERMSGYVPGEQPRVDGLIKLNTNENPYPPSPRVLEALRGSVDGRLRLYPDPQATALREKLAQLHQFAPPQIVIGNGGDDILNLCVRAFCGEGEKLAYFWPSYSLYPVLAQIQGAAAVELPLNDDFQIDVHPGGLQPLASAKLLFVTQPNAPSGVRLPRVELQRAIEETPGVVVIDEAYADFAAEDCLDFARAYPNVVVARSLSKSYSLAGMRVGWAAGSADLVGALMKIKDSYNVNRLSLVAAEAAVQDQEYFAQTTRRICATRDRTRSALEKLGFTVYPSQTNFLFARPPGSRTAKEWFDALRERKILVRWWDADRIREFARVSIGTEEEMDRFVEVSAQMLSSPRSGGEDRT